jgi:16S rRNA A1518/A1519 N6-dimethyltransferase RsmA/KsgA/DIM1 with predicted DNA glycosylase/AP lyase activity
MAVLIVIVLSIIFLFGFVVWFGPPYLPTMKLQIETALDLLDLKPGQTMLELGSGDGRVLRAGAKRGLNVVGYEINPVLIVLSRLTTWRYRKHVKLVWGDMWRKDWPPTDGIFTFLLERFMPKLDTKITQTYPGSAVKVASFAFEMPNKKPKKEKNGIFLYLYRKNQTKS